MNTTLPVSPSICPILTLSVVSHGQGDLVQKLLHSLSALTTACDFEVLVTQNIDESIDLASIQPPFAVHLIQNTSPLGFGANHNQAFRHARGAYFCVINPDIVLQQNPFAVLLQVLSQSDVGVVAPKVIAPNGALEDSVRRFPSVLSILRKACGGNAQPDYRLSATPQDVDWVGGMCMVFRREVFAEMDGFDERYFLYYEDVDLCARLWARGYRVVACPQAQVTHDARRHSHRNWRYMRWHLASMLRFFISHAWRRWRLSGPRA